MKFGSYIIIPEKNLIIEYHSGDINIDEFIHSRKIISSDPIYNKDFDLILDYLDVNMLVSQKDIGRFIDFFKGFNQILGNRKSAYLTSRPKEVAVTTVFSSELADLPIKPMTFSTIEALLNWLNNSNIDKEFLVKTIDQIKAGPNRFYQ